MGNEKPSKSNHRKPPVSLMVLSGGGHRSCHRIGSSVGDVEPELLQVFRQLAVDAPGFALASRRAAEQEPELREHGAHGAFRLAVVWQHGTLLHATDELVAADAICRAIRTVTCVPKALEGRRQL